MAVKGCISEVCVCVKRGRKREGDRETEIERYDREIYLKELAHIIVEAGKPKIHEGGQQAGDREKS